MAASSGAETLLRLIVGGRDDMSDRAARLASTAARESREVGDVVSRFVSELSDALLAQGRAAKEGADSQLATARDATVKQATEMSRVIANEVRAKPLQTLLVVAAAGIVLGWLAKR